MSTRSQETKTVGGESRVRSVEAYEPKPCKHATADVPVCFNCTRDRAYVRYEKRVPGADYGVIPLNWEAPEVCRG